ncbi:hypothetical protein NSB1T_06505 [Coprobacter fastidiosus NSB1 = JCM 33896]|nr:hypothetical protein NSB1T_06505 [Coprobacter fastidiosus NSB1 = JCM 33896]
MKTGRQTERKHKDNLADFFIGKSNAPQQG